jgi:hypothetical protein
VVLARLQRQIQIGTEEGGAEFGLCGMPHKPNYAERRIMPHDRTELVDIRVKCSA